MPGEFDIIQKHFSFSRPTISNGIVLGVGDDAAILNATSGRLIVAMDTLVENTHFLPKTSARHIATRALGVNLSDFAAMGARPRWFTLSLTLPDANEYWLQDFALSLASCAKQHNVSLVGGDTCRGPMSISLTVIGDQQQTSLTRSGGRPDDDLWVSGCLGLGAAALALQQGDAALITLNASDQAELLSHFFEPAPQLALGESLRGIATAAIDVSDGLAADAKHIAQQSGVSLKIDIDSLPLPSLLKGKVADSSLRNWAFAGDDYQLLFTAARAQRASIESIGKILDLRLTRIGSVLMQDGHKPPEVLLEKNGVLVDAPMSGYQHF